MGSPPPARFFSISAPITIMRMPNRISKFWPSSCLATLAPANAPATPASENTIAQGQRTLPARQCAIMLANALIATAIALVPIATCGEATPTP